MERYFAEAVAVFAADGPPDFAKVTEIAARYQRQLDFESVPLLAQKHGLVLG